jgi:hypothetical protein
MDVKMVVFDGDRYLTQDQEWTLDPKRARCYVSSMAFRDAEAYGGRVFLRFANKREINVSFNDMFDREEEALQ